MRIAGLVVCLFAISVACDVYLVAHTKAMERRRAHEAVRPICAEEAETSLGANGSANAWRSRWAAVQPTSVPEFLAPNLETDANNEDESEDGSEHEYEWADASDEGSEDEAWEDAENELPALLDVCVFNNEGVPAVGVDVFLRADRDGHTWAERTNESACARFLDVPMGLASAAVIRGVHNPGHPFRVEAGHNEFIIILGDEEDMLHMDEARDGFTTTW